MTDIISYLKDNLLNEQKLNEVRENIIQNTDAEEIEKARLQINYQLICTALEYFFNGIAVVLVIPFFCRCLQGSSDICCSFAGCKFPKWLWWVA